MREYLLEWYLNFKRTVCLRIWLSFKSPEYRKRREEILKRKYAFERFRRFVRLSFREAFITEMQQEDNILVKDVSAKDPV
jgi:hypothetical protein